MLMERSFSSSTSCQRARSTSTPSPHQHYWEDLRVGRRRSDDGESDPGTLLRSFGRRAQDLHVQLINGLLAEGSGESSCPARMKVKRCSPACKATAATWAARAWLAPSPPTIIP